MTFLLYDLALTGVCLPVCLLP